MLHSVRIDEGTHRYSLLTRVEGVDEDELDQDDEDEEDTQAEDDLEDQELPDATKTPRSVDELADIVNNKGIGAVQYMKKSTGEVIELREIHFRYARVWGVVSMGREFTPLEYARIMLAAEILEDEDAFYVLPSLTDDEMQEAIIGFCEEKYGVNGKKYAKNTEKFAKLVKSYDDMDEWLSYSKTAVIEKIVEFCAENDISFDNTDDAKEEPNE